MHGVEELLDPQPPYLMMEQSIEYTVIDRAAGTTETVEHRRHDFDGWGQRYERMVDVMPPGTYHRGLVGDAVLHVFEAAPMWAAALEAYAADPLHFVDRIKPGTEEHILKVGATGNLRYFVGANPTPAL